MSYDSRHIKTQFERPAAAKNYRSARHLLGDPRPELFKKQQVVLPAAGKIRPLSYNIYDESTSSHDPKTNVICSGNVILMGNSATDKYYIGILASDGIAGEKQTVYTSGKWFLPLDWKGDSTATPARVAASDKQQLAGKMAYYLPTLGLVTDQVPAATVSSDLITLTSAQTTVNSASITWETTGQGLKVYMEGAASGTPDRVLLTLGVDYTITDNNTIELESGATANDKLYIESVVQLEHLKIGEFCDEGGHPKPVIPYGLAWALVDIRPIDQEGVAEPAAAAISFTPEYAVFPEVANSNKGLKATILVNPQASNPNEAIEETDITWVYDTNGTPISGTGSIITLTTPSAQTETLDITVKGTTFNFNLTTSTSVGPVLVKA